MVFHQLEPPYTIEKMLQATLAAAGDKTFAKISMRQRAEVLKAISRWCYGQDGSGWQPTVQEMASLICLIADLCPNFPDKQLDKLTKSFTFLFSLPVEVRQMVEFIPEPLALRVPQVDPAIAAEVARVLAVAGQLFQPALQARESKP